MLSQDVRVLTSTLRNVVQALEENNSRGNTQTFEVKTSMGGFATGVAVASCVITLVVMIAFIIIENRSYAHLDNQMDQLKAWNDINRAKIAALEAKAKP